MVRFWSPEGPICAMVDVVGAGMDAISAIWECPCSGALPLPFPLPWPPRLPRLLP